MFTCIFQVDTEIQRDISGTWSSHVLCSTGQVSRVILGCVKFSEMLNLKEEKTVMILVESFTQANRMLDKMLTKITTIFFFSSNFTFLENLTHPSVTSYVSRDLRHGVYHGQASIGHSYIIHTETCTVTLQYCTVQYGTVQCSTVLYFRLN